MLRPSPPEVEEPDASRGKKSLQQQWAMHAHQRLFREWCSPYGTASAYLGESSTCDQTIDPAESSEPRSTSHGHTRSGRGCCGLMIHHSLLPASTIEPWLSDHQKKSIILIVPTKFSTRVGRAGWFGVNFVRASSLNLCLFRAKQSWTQQPRSQHLWRSSIGI